MKSRDLLVYVTAGAIAGGLIAWSAKRNSHTNLPPDEAAVSGTVPSLVTDAAPLPATASSPPTSAIPSPIAGRAAPSPAASTVPPPSEQSLESVPRISLSDFSNRLDRAEIVVIDVRAVEDYTAGHIPGAIHIPLSFMQGELPYLPRGKPIVTYCT